MNLLLSLFLACSNPYQEALDAGTVEAYEAFLTENPKHKKARTIQGHLEEKLREAAKESKDITQFDAYLERFKDTTSDKNAYARFVSAREDVMWNKALDAHTEKAYQSFILEYKSSSPRRARMAEEYSKVAAYEKNLSRTPIEIEQVNMANDPDGPLNGWKISTDLTNNGPASLSRLKYRINFLDAEGNIVHSDEKSEDTIVIGELKGREWATPDYMKPPFKPKETRSWSYMTGDVPPDWSRKVELTIIKLRKVGEKD